MKVGDYVRFDYHRVSTPIQIAKITETHYDNEDDSICYSTDIDLVIDKSNLVKEPSPNIIDLIEVGDYVNGMKITNKFIDEETGNIELEFNNGGSYLYPKSWNYEARSKKHKIKSIVTKEQFSQMEYRIGE